MRKQKDLVEVIEKKAERLAEWWPYLDAPYLDLTSRREETPGLAGFDATPTTRPCEHRLEWRFGKLCLACDNTGWRPLTKSERTDHLGVDPYSAQISSGITIVRDESPASRRARDGERIDAILAGLELNSRIRAGIEVPEDPAMRDYRLVSRKPRMVKKILRGVEILAHRAPDLKDSLPSRPGMVALALVMHRWVPGRISAP